VRRPDSVAARKPGGVVLAIEQHIHAHLVVFTRQDIAKAPHRGFFMLPPEQPTRSPCRPNGLGRGTAIAGCVLRNGQCELARAGGGRQDVQKVQHGLGLRCFIQNTALENPTQALLREIGVLGQKPGQSIHGHRALAAAQPGIFGRCARHRIADALDDPQGAGIVAAINRFQRIDGFAAIARWDTGCCDPAWCPTGLRLRNGGLRGLLDGGCCGLLGLLLGEGAQRRHRGRYRKAHRNGLLRGAGDGGLWNNGRNLWWLNVAGCGGRALRCGSGCSLRGPQGLELLVDQAADVICGMALSAVAQNHGTKCGHTRQ
jgi:hypothetical protein